MTDPTQARTGDWNELDEEERKQWLQSCIGYPESTVRWTVELSGCPFFVTMRDNVCFSVMLEKNPDRVNVHVEKGKVVRAYTG